MAYKEGKYWDERHDEAMKVIFTTPNDSREWLESYRIVLPRLRRMAESILRRYYSYLVEQHANDLITDAIAQLLIHGKYDPDKPKMFAYCGTILKRYFYTKLVAVKQYNNYETLVDNNYDINDNEWLSNNYVHNPDEDWQQERQEQLEYILNLIDTNIIKIYNAIPDKQKHKNQFSDSHEVGKHREIRFLKLSREYFMENFTASTVSTMGMADYIQTRMDIPNYLLSRLQNNHFGMGSQPERMDVREGKDYIGMRETSYILDDYTPNDTKKPDKRKSNKKLSPWHYF